MRTRTDNEIDEAAQRVEEVEVDQRLLLFLPFYKKLWLRNNPNHVGEVPDQDFRKALLKALEHAGHAKRVQKADGRLHLVPTDEYLKWFDNEHS